METDHENHHSPYKHLRLRTFWNKGTISCVITLVALIAGVILVEFEWKMAGQYLLSFGIFGFAGGSTNWIAITMLFDEIPVRDCFKKRSECDL